MSKSTIAANVNGSVALTPYSKLFINRVNAELINKIANLVSRVVPFVTRQFGGRLGQLSPDVQPLIDDIRQRLPRIRECYERLEFSRVVQDIVAIAGVKAQ